MLVLKINEGEKIKIGDNIELLFKCNSGQHATDVCIDAPKEVGISRISEHEKKRLKNLICA